MTQSAHTRCWGVLLAFGLQLPTAAPPAPPAVPPASPPPATTAAAAPPTARAPVPAPYVHAWTTPLAAGEPLLLTIAHGLAITAGRNTPLEVRALETSDLAWTQALTDWQAVAASETLVFGVAGDRVYAFDAASGERRWTAATSGPNTRLVAAHDRVLLVTDRDVLMRDAATGAILPDWHWTLLAPPARAPAVVGAASVVVALANGSVVSFDLATGTPRWTTVLGQPPDVVAVHGAFVYAGLPDGQLCWLRDRDGRRDQCYPLRVPFVGIAADDQGLYAALLDGTVRVHDLRSGAMRRTDQLGYRPAAGPWLTHAGLVLALTTGEFVVVSRDTGRTTSRAAMAEAGASQLLERSAVSPDGHWLASLTIAPGGERRLSVYGPPPPIDHFKTPTRILPQPRVTTLPGPPPLTGSERRPRPFPAAR